MATKLHNQMSGADLHPNAIDGTTGTELTLPSQTTYDGRYVRTIGGTITPTANGTATFKVTKADGTTQVLNIDTTNARLAVGRATAGAALDIDQTSAGDVFVTRNSGNQRFTINQAGGTDTIGSSNSNLQINASSTVQVSQYGTEKIRMDSSGNWSVNATTGNAKLYVNGSLGTAITTTAKTANYTATITDSTITADATGGAVQITLPTAVGCAGRQYTVKRTGATNNVTVGGTSAQTLDGATTKTLSAQFSSLTVQSDNANWQIIALVGTVS